MTKENETLGVQSGVIKKSVDEDYFKIYMYEDFNKRAIFPQVDI